MFQEIKQRPSEPRFFYKDSIGTIRGIAADMLGKFFNRNSSKTPAALSAQDQALLNAALFSAVEMNQMDDAKKLIAKGADKNARNSSQDTPLIVAAREGVLEMVDYFLSLDVDLKAQNHFQQNALLVALREHHEDVAIQLITAGVPVNVTDKFGLSPMYLAAQDGREKTIKLLVAAGADVNTANKDGCTSLNIAAGLGHMRAVDELISAKADVNIGDKHGWTPLMRAVNLGNQAMIQKLLNAGADLRAQNKEGESILDVARMQGKNEVIDIIEKKLAADEDARYAPIVKGTLREVKTIKTISFKPRTPVG